MENANAAARWRAQFEAYHIPRWNELPDIELYMDQVISQLDKYLAALNAEDAEHFVTASMINNYVKMNLLPAPVKKRYGRAHLAHLVIICLLKQVLSIPEVKHLLDNNLTSAENLPQTYNVFCEAQEKAYTDIAQHACAPDTQALPAPTLAVEMAVLAGASKALAQALLARTEQDKPSTR